MGFISKLVSGAADNRHQRDMQIREHEMEKLRMAENQKYMEQLDRQATADREAHKEMMDRLDKRSSDDFDKNMETIDGLKDGNNKPVPDPASAEGSTPPPPAKEPNAPSGSGNQANGAPTPTDNSTPPAPNKETLVHVAAGNPH